MEEWRKVSSPFDNYEISNMGRIRNKYGKVMKTTYDKHGYERLTLNCKPNSKTVKIHRLVAEAFIPNDDPDNNTVVNHMDGNKKNNNVSNLEWTTYSHNNSHAIQMGLKAIKGTSNPANKYPEEKIRRVCEMIAEGEESNVEIARAVFKVIDKKETRRLSKLVSQIRTKDRWSVISDEYF